MASFRALLGPSPRRWRALSLAKHHKPLTSKFTFTPPEKFIQQAPLQGKTMLIFFQIGISKIFYFEPILFVARNDGVR
jgi:hypothetical protein